MRKKIVIKMLNHAPFRGEVEIDEYIAAEDDVQTLHENHAGVIGKVQAAKGYAVAHKLLDLQLIGRGREIFLTVIGGQVPCAIAAIDCVLCVGKRALVEIRGEDFNRPVLEFALRLFQHSILSV